jgi:hypothetical protein
VNCEFLTIFPTNLELAAKYVGWIFVGAGFVKTVNCTFLGHLLFRSIISILIDSFLAVFLAFILLTKIVLPIFPLLYDQCFVTFVPVVSTPLGFICYHSLLVMCVYILTVIIVFYVLPYCVVLLMRKIKRVSKKDS